MAGLGCAIISAEVGEVTINNCAPPPSECPPDKRRFGVRFVAVRRRHKVVRIWAISRRNL